VTQHKRRHVLQSLRRRIRPTLLERRIAALELGAGDLAVDCGANVGTVTSELARTGAYVHAFEPNPDAYAVLEERFEHVDNVELHRDAVLDHVGSVRLYLHVDAVGDPVGSSLGSSLLVFKGHVDPNRFVEVQAIDLAEFVLGLERPVAVLKLDVEGVECPIVHRLIDTNAVERVGTVFVELHDRHIPELRGENDRLRRRLEREGLADRVLTNWE
jgi:FkbM family methyltransferase